jgi:hypothetical protein
MEDQKMEEKKKTAGKSTAFSITGKSESGVFFAQRVAESAFVRGQAAILGCCNATAGRTRTCAFFRRELARQRLKI